MITATKITVSEILSLVRGKIFDSSDQDTLSNSKYFEQMCCALDTVGDTEMAISAYRCNKLGEDVSSKYLAVYGLLQAIFVQQDAVQHLCNSIELSGNILQSYPRLKRIREIRNDIVGHPTNRGFNSGTTSYHYISQITMNHDGFTCMTCFDGNTSAKFKKVNLLALISDQEKCVSSILASLLEKLKNDDETHKRKFNMSRLTKIFDHEVYLVSKIYLGIRTDYTPELNKVNLVEIEKIVKKFLE